MTMRKLCILCCIVVICILVCFPVYADVITPDRYILPIARLLPQIIGERITEDLRAFWGVIVAAALAVAAFFSQIFHKK